MSITAMKQALEALEECVYWYGARDKEEQLMSTDNQNREIKKSIEAITSLRQAIEQAEQAKPNFWAGVDFDIKTALPQRQPLTDEEIAKIAEKPQAFVVSYAHSFARAIEAAHGIKQNFKEQI